MIRAILDTSLIITGLPENVIDRLEDYRSSAIVRGELLRGYEHFRASGMTKRASKRRILIASLDSVPDFWVPFTIEDASAYGVLTASSESTARLKDALIASQAIRLGVPLMTGDRGFRRFPQLEIVEGEV